MDLVAPSLTASARTGTGPGPTWPARRAWNTAEWYQQAPRLRLLLGHAEPVAW